MYVSIDEKDKADIRDWAFYRSESVKNSGVLSIAPQPLEEDLTINGTEEVLSLRVASPSPNITWADENGDSMGVCPLTINYDRDVVLRDLLTGKTVNECITWAVDQTWEEHLEFLDYVAKQFEVVKKTLDGGGLKARFPRWGWQDIAGRFLPTCSPEFVSGYVTIRKDGDWKFEYAGDAPVISTVTEKGEYGFPATSDSYDIPVNAAKDVRRALKETYEKATSIPEWPGKDDFPEGFDLWLDSEEGREAYRIRLLNEVRRNLEALVD